MTDFGDWIRKDMPRPWAEQRIVGDLANLTAQLEETVVEAHQAVWGKKRHAESCGDVWHSTCVALAACKEFQEKYQ